MTEIKAYDISQKLVPIYGDLSKTDLGISDENRDILIQNVSVVLHVAANVKLDPPLRNAINDNLISTISLIQLCRQFTKLECFTYVSTLAVLNHKCGKQESVYSTSVSPEHVLNSCQILNDQQLLDYRKQYFPEFPNTYTISKALAEQILLSESERMNIAIVRPSITISAYKEPVPGWVQGLHGPTSFAILTCLGMLRICPFNKKTTQFLIPVDFVVNLMIASSWFVSTQKYVF